MPDLNTPTALVEAYRDAEVYLLRLIAEATQRGATGTTRHLEAQQQEVARLIKLAQARLDQLAGGISKAALEQIEQDYAAAVAEAYAQTGNPAPALTNVNAAQAIAQATAETVVSQHTQILRTVADAYRDVAQNVLMRAALSGETNLHAAQQFLNRLADKGITSFTDRAGRKWSMDTYTDMAVRTGRMRAFTQGNLDGWAQTGVELVRVSWHQASAPQCFPFQNELLAVVGPAGDRTVTNRITGEPMTVHAKATFAEAVAEGYKHPNCRHSEAPFVPGVELPEPPDLDEAENEAQYKAQQRQRQIERNIRQWKKQQAVALTSDASARAERYIRGWQAQQRAHIKVHPFLRRRPDREQLRAGVQGAALDTQRFDVKPKTAAAKPIPAKFIHTAKPTTVTLKGDSKAATKATQTLLKDIGGTNVPQADAWARLVTATGADGGWNYTQRLAAHRYLTKMDQVDYLKKVADGKLISPLTAEGAKAARVTAMAEAKELRAAFLDKMHQTDGAKLLKEAENVAAAKLKGSVLTMKEAKLAGYKQPFSAANADTWANYVVASGKFTPDTTDLARAVLEAKHHKALTDLAVDSLTTVGGELKVAAKSLAKDNYANAKKGLMAAVKGELSPDTHDTLLKAMQSGKAAEQVNKLFPAKVAKPEQFKGGPTLPEGITKADMDAMVTLKLNQDWGHFDPMKAALAQKTGLTPNALNDLVNDHIGVIYGGKVGKLSPAEFAKVQAEAKGKLGDAKKLANAHKPKPPTTHSGYTKPHSAAPKRAEMPPGFENDPTVKHMAALRAANQPGELQKLAAEYATAHGLRTPEVLREVTELADKLYEGATAQAVSAAPIASVKQAQKDVRKFASKTGKPKAPAKDTGEVNMLADPSSAMKWGSETWETYSNIMDPEISGPLHTYTTNAFHKINNALRSSKGQKAHSQKFLSDIDKSFAKVPRNPEPIMLHRGTSRHQFIGNCLTGEVTSNPASWVGKEFIEHGYMSTSLGGSAAFGGEVRMHIHVPTGNKMAYVGPDSPSRHSNVISQYPSEREMILQRGTRFTVTKIEQNGGTTDVWVTVTGQDH